MTSTSSSSVTGNSWHDGTAYDPAKHNALQAILARQDAQAAGTAPQDNQ